MFEIQSITLRYAVRTTFQHQQVYNSIKTIAKENIILHTGHFYMMRQMMGNLQNVIMGQESATNIGAVTEGETSRPHIVVRLIQLV